MNRAPKIKIAPLLSVRNGAKAIDFYKAAFDAEELVRIESPDGDVVAQLKIGESEFWLADESPQHQNFSPETLGGGTVRMVMVVENPDATFGPGHRGWSQSRFPRCGSILWLARRPRRRSVRPSLGNWQTVGRLPLNPNTFWHLRLPKFLVGLTTLQYSPRNNLAR